MVVLNHRRVWNTHAEGEQCAPFLIHLCGIRLFGWLVVWLFVWLVGWLVGCCNILFFKKIMLVILKGDKKENREFT